MQSLDPIIQEIGSMHRSIAKLESRKAQPTDEIYIENLDEIKLHLRGELERFGKSLKDILQSSKLPSFNISETIKLSNIGDLERSLKALQLVVSTLDKKISKINFEPNVNVTATVPTVNIPEIKLPMIHVPKIDAPSVTVNPIVDIDLTSLLEALEPLALLSNSPDSPISVRLSDGQDFIEEITTALREGQEQMATVVSTSYGLSKDEYKAAEAELSYNMSGASAVLALSNGTATQLSATSVACKSVHITVTGGPVAVGFSSAVLATSGSEYGVLLYPASIPYVIETSNLNLIYVAGASGRRVCYNYYS